MKINNLVFVIDEKNNIIDKPVDTIRPYTDNTNIIYFVGPYTNNQNIEVQFSYPNSTKKADRRQMLLAKNRNNNYILGKDLVKSSKFYFQTVKDYNVWGIEVPVIVLNTIIKNKSSRVAIDFYISDIQPDPRATNYLGTFGSNFSTLKGDLKYPIEDLEIPYIQNGYNITLPTGTKDFYDPRVKKYFKRVNLKFLEDNDFIAIDSYPNIDYIIIKKPEDYINYNSLAYYTNYILADFIPESFSNNLGSFMHIGKIIPNMSGDAFYLGVPPETYTLGEALDYINTLKLYYQIVEEIYIPYTLVEVIEYQEGDYYISDSLNYLSTSTDLTFSFLQSAIWFNDDWVPGNNFLFRSKTNQVPLGVEKGVFDTTLQQVDQDYTEEILNLLAEQQSDIQHLIDAFNALRPNIDYEYRLSLIEEYLVNYEPDEIYIGEFPPQEGSKDKVWFKILN